MDTPNSAALLEQFKGVEDPRVERTREYELLDIILIAVCAVIAGVDD